VVFQGGFFCLGRSFPFPSLIGFFPSFCQALAEDRVTTPTKKKKKAASAVLSVWPVARSVAQFICSARSALLLRAATNVCTFYSPISSPLTFTPSCHFASEHDHSLSDASSVHAPVQHRNLLFACLGLSTCSSERVGNCYTNFFVYSVHLRICLPEHVPLLKGLAIAIMIYYIGIYFLWLATDHTLLPS